MTRYHYAVVRCRHGAVQGEWRNIAVLVVSPSERRSCMRRARLGERAQLEGNTAAFVTALLDDLEARCADEAARGDAAAVHAWLRTRAAPGEDGLSLTAPAVGVAVDLAEEAGRLARAYLGEADDVSA